jgi:hypothetical protein
MCYYSQTLRADEFRNAKEGEDLTLHADTNSGHTYPKGEDGKVVCIAQGTIAQVEKLELNPEYERQLRRDMPGLEDYLGKPYETRFSPHTRGYSADHLMVGPYFVHLIYLKSGMKLYTGPKRLPNLGVDDPSIALDHRVDASVMEHAD